MTFEFLMAALLSLHSLFRQTNCIEEMTCWPGSNPMEVFKIYNYVYGIPNPATLGLFLGILIGGIYLHQRSLTQLAILGIYAIGAVTATWLSDPYVAQQYELIRIVIIVAISAAVVIMVIKTFRE